MHFTVRGAQQPRVAGSFLSDSAELVGHGAIAGQCSGPSCSQQASVLNSSRAAKEQAFILKKKKFY